MRGKPFGTTRPAWARTPTHLTDGGCFDAPVDDCKAKTLVIQEGTLIWK